MTCEDMRWYGSQTNTNPLDELSAEERATIREELAQARAAGMMPRIHMSIFSRPKILAPSTAQIELRQKWKTGLARR